MSMYKHHKQIRETLGNILLYLRWKGKNSKTLYKKPQVNKKVNSDCKLRHFPKIRPTQFNKSKKVTLSERIIKIHTIIEFKTGHQIYKTMAQKITPRLYPWKVYKHSTIIQKLINNQKNIHKHIPDFPATVKNGHTR